MISELSILIPSYNNVCTQLVQRLQQLCERVVLDSPEAFCYEILVADDGSTDRQAVTINRSINAIAHCRLIEIKENVGRSAVRNVLAREASYEWILYLDCDVVIERDDFIGKYLMTGDRDVVYGGLSVGGDAKALSGNLRYLYEIRETHRHQVEERRKHPYRSFSAANFMVRRNLMLNHPFDERIRRYGYEDVLFGKELECNKIPIAHIDNPVTTASYDANDVFVSKMEEGLCTLHDLRDELRTHSRLIILADQLRPFKPFIVLWHKLFGAFERRNLTGGHPSLRVLNIYKIGYYMSLRHHC